MDKNPGHDESDSRVDALAILALIILVVVTAVYWVGSQ